MSVTPEPLEPAEPEPAVEEPKVVFQCQRCGHDLPPMDADLARIAKNSGTVIAHAICPGEEPVRRRLRHFEVRVSIVELTVADDGEVIDDLEEEMIVFKHSLEAEDLDAAMRPLAEGLGQKWMAAEKQAKVADSA